MFSRKYWWHPKTLAFSGHLEEDERRPEDETGYIAPYHGDSGSPHWIQSSDNNGKMRFTTLAVLAGPGYDPNHPNDPVKSKYVRSIKHSVRQASLIVILYS